MRRANLEKLKNAADKQQVQQHLNDSICSITTATTDVQKYWHSLKQCIQETTETMLGHQAPKKKQLWMTQHILDQMSEQRIYKNNNWEKYKEMQQKIREEIRKAKEKWMGEQYKQEKLDNWTNYIHKLFGAARTPAEKDQQVPEEALHILTSEVEYAIKTAKSGKACGPDTVHVELLKQLDIDNIRQLTNWYNQVYNSNNIPSDWLQSIFVAIPKKATSRKCKDYRLLSLMSHVLKVFLKVIQQRICCTCKNALKNTQFGFCKGLGTREAIFGLQILLQRCYEHQEEVYICFIDYEKAFDSVDHNRLATQLKQLGLDKNDINFIIALYWNQTAQLWYNNELTDPIPIQKGVRQGCPLSPILFNIYSEQIFDQTLADKNIGIKVNGQYINNIRYANDTALVADSEQDLQQILDEVAAEGQIWGLRINKKKTKVMKVSRTPSNTTIKLGNEKLEQVHRYKYLGGLIDDQLNHEVEIKSRIEQARQAITKWKTLLADRNLNTRLKLRTLKCYIWSILLYGVETWTLTTVTTKRLVAFEMWLYQRMLKIPWTAKITNAQVLQDMGTDRQLLKTIISRKCNYLGHIARNDHKYQLLQQILQGKIEGKKLPGRPKTTWLSNIKTWLQLTTAQTLHAVLDRDQYHREVAPAVSQH
uniref:Reverse transcriptase domain-containing protein n=1 Tax=Plectus sambesii TaxID=2011161 RepID=A0A914WK67_9BILA